MKTQTRSPTRQLRARQLKSEFVFATIQLLKLTIHLSKMAKRPHKINEGMVKTVSNLRRQAVFGGADGLTVVLGLVVGMSATPHALWKAALCAGLAELAGMAGGAWLSGETKLAALANGVASLAACAIPAAPYAFTFGAFAAVVSVALVATEACLIAWLRPDANGWRGWVQTFGVLFAAAVLVFAAGRL